MSWGWSWRPYVPVAERRRKAMLKVEKMKKKGQEILPVTISGRKIASTFWGQSWCENLEAYSDYANRLPRGRTYVRNGSVIDLQIQAGQVNALVSGGDLYKVNVEIKTLPTASWKVIKESCMGKILSLLDLLQGKLSSTVMEIVTKKKTGLFPEPTEMAFKCSCPDWAYMCKHVAAVLYGVGARLDHAPELLFILRNVNHNDLISHQAAASAAVSAKAGDLIIAADQLTEIFGIDIEGAETAIAADPPKKRAAKTNKAAAPEKVKKPDAGKMKSEKQKKNTVKDKKLTAAKKTVDKKKPAVKKKKTATAAQKKIQAPLPKRTVKSK